MGNFSYFTGNRPVNRAKKKQEQNVSFFKSSRASINGNVDISFIQVDDFLSNMTKEKTSRHGIIRKC